MAAIDHVRYLVETIGPRGSTREAEAQAARYAAAVLKEMGLEPVTERFMSARSKYHPFALSSGVGLVCVALFGLGGQTNILLALVLHLLNLASVTLHICYRSNPLHWLLPRGPSQNVYARVPPRGPVRCRAVLLAHLDSNRTPLLNSNPRWLRVYKTLLPVSFIAGVILILLLAAGLYSTEPMLRLFSLLPALIFLATCLLMLQADFTPFTVGANDNASAVGVTLHLANRLVHQPLAHTEVWPVLDGCEEVSLYGADAFARAHRGELRDALWIVLDSIGGAGGELSYTESETLLLTVRSDPELARIFDEVARVNPELCAVPLRFRTGANATDGTMLGLHGLRQIAVIAPGLHGQELEVHKPTDDMQHIDRELLERSETLVWQVLHKIDSETANLAR